MDFWEAKRVAKGLKLTDVVIDCEQRRVRGAIGLAATELVVNDDWPVLGQREERAEIVAA